MLELKKSFKKDDRQLASLNGELCLPALRQIMPAMSALLSEVSYLVIDLAGITAMDAAGLQLLAVFKKTAALQNKKLKLINHSPAVIDCLAGFGAIGLFQDRIILHSGGAKSAKFRYGLTKQEFV